MVPSGCRSCHNRYEAFGAVQGTDELRPPAGPGTGTGNGERRSTERRGFGMTSLFPAGSPPDSPTRSLSMQCPSYPPLHIKGKSLVPIVQGGMGVGISAHRLAGNVARLGAVGTIASVDLRRHHPDLMEWSGRGRNKAVINEANLIALDREIAQGQGMIAVNVMRAVSQYAAFVRQACESGAGAIVMGAGLPLDLPDLTAGYPDVALIPILSDVRGINVVVKKWARKDRLPDAIVIEHPFFAGGHLGATRLEDLDEPRFDFETVIPARSSSSARWGSTPAAFRSSPRAGSTATRSSRRSLRSAPVLRRSARRSP